MLESEMRALQPVDRHRLRNDSELDRLTSIRRLELTSPEHKRTMDLVVGMLADATSFPIAIVTIVESDHLVIPAAVGAEFDHAPRDVAFCNHTIEDELPLMVPDALLDDRFRDNPMVIGEPRIRSYAGVSLRTPDGQRVGTLCIMDNRPRNMDDNVSESLNRHAAILEKIIALVDGMASIRQELRETSDAMSRAERLELERDLLERQLDAGVWSLDLDDSTVTWSPGIFRLYGLETDRGPLLEEAMSYYPEPDRNRVAQAINQARETGRGFDLELSFTDATGGQRRVHARGDVRESRDGRSQLIGLFRDITQKKLLLEKVERAQDINPITGIYNASRFFREVTDRAAKRPITPFALVIVSITNLSVVRHAHGVWIIDVLMREISRSIRQFLGQDELVGHTSNDEFSLLLTESCQGDELRSRLQLIGDWLGNNISIIKDRLEVVPRLGAAVFPDHGNTSGELARAADLAMRNDQETGIVALYTDELDERFRLQNTSTSFVQQALWDGRVEPFFQPIARVGDLEIAGFEALARVRNPDGTITDAELFWPALMEPQTSRQLGRVVLASVATQLRLWNKGPMRNRFIALNAGIADLDAGGMVDELLEMISNREVDPSRLKLEVTENILLDGNGSRALTRLDDLRRVGVRLAFDDFGTGYGSLRNLKEANVDEIKIDKSFVDQLVEEDSSRAIVESIVRLAHQIGMQTVAEGVETNEQLEAVRALGCDYVQGFLVGRAAAALEAETRILST